MKRMEHTLYGNGQKGIQQIVQEIHASIKLAIFIIPIAIALTGLLVEFMREQDLKTEFTTHRSLPQDGTPSGPASMLLPPAVSK